MRFPLRAKFFVFATLIATAPLALVGQNLVRIARDELKSAANEDLTGVAAGLASDFDATVEGRWLTPLLVIRNGVDSDALGVEQKISLLTLGLSQIPDIVALQLTRRGLGPADPRHRPGLLPAPRRGRPRPGRDAAQPRSTPSPPIRRDGRYGELLPRRLEATGDWLATVAFPLRTQLAGRERDLLGPDRPRAARRAGARRPLHPPRRDRRRRRRRPHRARARAARRSPTGPSSRTPRR